jgi:ferritin
MKLHAEIEKAISEQINLEFLSAYAYLAMAAWFENKSLAGFASWMTLQGQEELGHGMKFFRYLNDRGGRVLLETIPRPKADFASPLEAFETSLAHEQSVSTCINRIYELASQQKDFPTLSFLRWFLDEQVEEEKTVSDVIAKLKLVGENDNGVFHLDNHLAERAKTKP